MEGTVRDGARVPAEPVYATIANGFDNGKNTAAAIAAFAGVRRSLPGARLIMWGRDHETDGVARRYASSRGIDVGIEWRGQAPHRTLLSALQREVDVLVHASRMEACSMAIMEAQSCGLPVIGGANSGGVPYSLMNGRAGILVDVTDVDALTGAMEQALGLDEYRRLSAGSLEAINGPFALDRVVDDYEALYRSLTSAT
jgi:glycosyltransferase involved in cell wall biosynthesis